MSSPLDDWKDYLIEKEKEKAEREVKNIKDKKKLRMFYLFFEITLSFIGVIVFYLNTNFWAFIGLFLMLWGNNLGSFRTILSNSIYRKIWGEDTNEKNK